MSKANIPIGPGLVNPSHDQDETLTKCPSPDKMSDSQLVNYIGRQFTKFLLEMRPYLIEVHTRFIQKKATRRPFLGYTDWDKFCPDFFNYTGRHVRRISSISARNPSNKYSSLSNTIRHVTPKWRMRSRRKSPAMLPY